MGLVIILKLLESRGRMSSLMVGIVGFVAILVLIMFMKFQSVSL